MASAKAEQIVDHFTQDPALKQKVLDLIDEIIANPGKHNFDTVIARFTDDPELTATIKGTFEHVRAGHTMGRVAATHFDDDETIVRAAGNMAQHQAAVERILAS